MATKTQVAKEAATDSYVNRVKANYIKDVIPQLMKEFGYKSN